MLLPDCGLADAIAKAELLRARITASFGVATIPETSAQQGDILAMADAALYRAKQEGRNRVVAAVRRASRREASPLMAAAE